MSVFEFAMKMEEDGRDFYLQHAQAVSDPVLKKVLGELAEDESKHYEILKAMRDGQTPDYEEDKRTRILSTVKNVFETMKAEDNEFAFQDDVTKIWEEAREIERKSEAFYREKAREIDDVSQKHVLNRIADEEHKHWVAVENVVEFLNRPKQWLEDAEWSHLEDY